MSTSTFTRRNVIAGAAALAATSAATSARPSWAEEAAEAGVRMQPGTYVGIVTFHTAPAPMVQPGTFEDRRNLVDQKLRAFVSYTESMGARVELETEGYEIMYDEAENTVRGVKARNTQTGKEYVINSRAVIMGTGGFGNNSKMLETYLEPPFNGYYRFLGTGTDTGLMVQAAINIGAGTRTFITAASICAAASAAVGVARADEAPAADSDWLGVEPEVGEPAQVLDYDDVRGDLGAVNTRYQKAGGCEIDEAAMLFDMYRFSNGNSSHALHKTWFDNSAEAVEWYGDILEANGITLWHELATENPDKVSLVKHWPTGHSPEFRPDAEGNMVSGKTVLSAYYAEKGGEVMYETGMVKLAVTDGAVTGVYAQDAEKADMHGCCRFFPYENGAPANETVESISGQIQSLIDAEVMQVADTVEELAQKLGIPADAFAATVARYNELAEKGVDEDFGKEWFRMAPVATAPFYGVRNSGILLCTLDGIRIDTQMRALRADGTAIEGLYVVGNDSGCYYDGSYINTSTGNAAGRTLTFGRMAGKAAAAR